jgi:hypothetical protein
MLFFTSTVRGVGEFFCGSFFLAILKGPLSLKIHSGGRNREKTTSEWACPPWHLQTINRFKLFFIYNHNHDHNQQRHYQPVRAAPTPVTSPHYVPPLENSIYHRHHHHHNSTLAARFAASPQPQNGGGGGIERKKKEEEEGGGSRFHYNQQSSWHFYCVNQTFHLEK